MSEYVTLDLGSLAPSAEDIAKEITPEQITGAIELLSVDEKPTEGSDKLAKSGGIFDKIQDGDTLRLITGEVAEESDLPDDAEQNSVYFIKQDNIYKMKVGEGWEEIHTIYLKRDHFDSTNADDIPPTSRAVVDAIARATGAPSSSGNAEVYETPSEDTSYDLEVGKTYVIVATDNELTIDLVLPDNSPNGSVVYAYVTTDSPDTNTVTVNLKSVTVGEGETLISPIVMTSNAVTDKGACLRAVVHAGVWFCEFFALTQYAGAQETAEQVTITFSGEGYKATEDETHTQVVNKGAEVSLSTEFFNSLYGMPLEKWRDSNDVEYDIGQTVIPTEDMTLYPVYTGYDTAQTTSGQQQFATVKATTGTSSTTKTLTVSPYNGYAEDDIYVKISAQIYSANNGAHLKVTLPDDIAIKEEAYGTAKTWSSVGTTDWVSIARGADGMYKVTLTLAAIGTGGTNAKGGYAKAWISQVRYQ